MLLFHTDSSCGDHMADDLFIQFCRPWWRLQTPSLKNVFPRQSSQAKGDQTQYIIVFSSHKFSMPSFLLWHHCFQAGTQFKSSLGQLMEILLSKQPSYIRCIKPNDHKQPSEYTTTTQKDHASRCYNIFIHISCTPDVFVEQIVRHQVKYLGLMENLRVRRAGFAYRRHYENFLHR